jgi:hypothetical protein
MSKQATAASCERVGTCSLFAQFRLKPSLQVWKSYYCEGNFKRCERWKIIVTGSPVSDRLLPNGRILDATLEELEPGHYYG